MAAQKSVSFVDPTPEQDNWKRTGRGFDTLRYCKELKRTYHIRMSIIASKWPDAVKFLNAIADGLTRADCEDAKKIFALEDGIYVAALGIKKDDEKAESIRSLLQGNVSPSQKQVVLKWMDAASFNFLYPLEKSKHGRKFLVDLEEALSGGELKESYGDAKRILAIQDGLYARVLKIEGDNDETKASCIKSVREEEIPAGKSEVLSIWLKAAKEAKIYPFDGSQDETDDAAIGEAHKAKDSDDASDNPFFPFFNQVRNLFKETN